jgi:hypothetical protein
MVGTSLAASGQACADTNRDGRGAMAHITQSLAAHQPDNRIGQRVAGKAGTKPVASAGPPPARVSRATVGASAATIAITGAGTAVARAFATAYATGSNSVARTFTNTYTVVTRQFSEAVAVAVSVATSVFGNSPGASAPGGNGAGLVGQAVAHANADAQATAMASGPRAGTRTVTEAFTRVTDRFAQAVAVSESMAISSNPITNSTSGRASPDNTNAGHGGATPSGRSYADGEAPVGQSGGTSTPAPSHSQPMKLGGTIHETPAPGAGVSSSQPRVSAPAPHSPQDPVWTPGLPAR